MDDISLTILFSILLILILLSAFFSSSETGMMAIDRYRLRHLANDKHGGAILVSKLLKHPDRLLGLILLGNTLANIAAAALATRRKENEGPRGGDRIRAPGSPFLGAAPRGREHPWKPRVAATESQPTGRSPCAS